MKRTGTLRSLFSSSNGACSILQSATKRSHKGAKPQRVYGFLWQGFNESDGLTGVHMTGGNDIAARTRGVFDECLADGYRRFDGGGLNLFHDLKDAVLGDGGVGSNADQRKISVFH